MEVTVKNASYKYCSTYYSFGYQDSEETRKDNVRFSQNSAGRGRTIYGGLLDRCIPATFSEISRDAVGRSYLTRISDIQNDLNTSEIESDPLTVHFCKSDVNSTQWPQYPTSAVYTCDMDKPSA